MMIQVYHWDGEQLSGFVTIKMTLTHFNLKKLPVEVPFTYSEKLFKQRKANTECNTFPLYSKQKTIPYAKWENLQQLLDFVPPIRHKFYKNLPHTEGPQKKGKCKTTKQGNAIKETQEAT